ncbi:MAG: hypothetical protein ACI9DK_003166, partial [Vicingaceae bacterium]
LKTGLSGLKPGKNLKISRIQTKNLKLENLIESYVGFATVSIHIKIWIQKNRFKFKKRFSSYLKRVVGTYFTIS